MTAHNSMQAAEPLNVVVEECGGIFGDDDLELPGNWCIQAVLTGRRSDYRTGLLTTYGKGQTISGVLNVCNGRVGAYSIRSNRIDKPRLIVGIFRQDMADGIVADIDGKCLQGETSASHHSKRSVNLQ